MNKDQTTRQIKALGLCSGGLDSILSALVLKDQGIDVTWVSFKTPFFNSLAAKKASSRTGIPLIVKDITDVYMKMMEAPQAGFGKNMNPCMDCHTLMFNQAAQIMKEEGFDFLFSGEVMGQRPKSQTKNALRYVEKNSGIMGYVVRPLSAKLLPETLAEQEGLVDREQLLDISGRSRKAQMALAEKYGIKDYPSPAGGCLLTDKGFSNRLRDLLYVQKTQEKRLLHMLKHGRHFRLSDSCKLVVGRTQGDNKQVMKYYDKDQDIRLRHAGLPGPEAILTGNITQADIEMAGQILSSYTKAVPGQPSLIRVFKGEDQEQIEVITSKAGQFKELMI